MVIFANIHLFANSFLVLIYMSAISIITSFVCSSSNCFGFLGSGFIEDDYLWLYHVHFFSFLSLPFPPRPSQLKALSEALPAPFEAP